MNIELKAETTIATLSEQLQQLSAGQFANLVLALADAAQKNADATEITSASHHWNMANVALGTARMHVEYAEEAQG